MQTAIGRKSQMRMRENATLDLNSQGRAQNKKYREAVCEPRVLSEWLNRWEGEEREEHGE